MNKRKTVALAAVMYYLQEERARFDGLEPSDLPEHHINPWAVYGRKTTARMNKLIQSQAFRKHHASPNNNMPEKGHLLQRAANLSVNMSRPIAHHAVERIQIAEYNEIKKMEQK